MEKVDKIEQLKTAFFQFLNSGAEDDMACAEDVCYTGEASEEQYEAVVLMRKVFSVLLLSAAREGLIPAIDERSIPWLYDEDCADEYREEIFPRRSEFGDWVIFNDRVIESFVMPVVKNYGWKEVMLLREREAADDLDIPNEVKHWVRDEVESVYDTAYEESDEDEECPEYFIPEGSGFAAVVYENPLYSRLVYLCRSLEGKGYRLDDILEPEMLAIAQAVIGYHFIPITHMYFSFQRLWVGEKCYHCCLTRDTAVTNDWGFEYLEGYSYYKYAHPSLIFELPELDAGMKKLLPVVEALVEKAEADELQALRAVA